MNPIDLVAVAYMDQGEGRKLVRLRDRLTGLGVNAELRDNNTALMVHRPSGGGMPVWVFVGYGGAYYSWQSAEKRHPVDDVAGAATVLAAYVGR
ncbi:hypothetical protein GCM10009658_35520 [Planotetraspora silvatica]